MANTTSFQRDIRPLFTQRDIDGMRRGSTWKVTMKSKAMLPLSTIAFVESVAR